MTCGLQTIRMFCHPTSVSIQIHTYESCGKGKVVLVRMVHPTHLLYLIRVPLDLAIWFILVYIELQTVPQSGPAAITCLDILLQLFDCCFSELGIDPPQSSNILCSFASFSSSPNFFITVHSRRFQRFLSVLGGNEIGRRYPLSDHTHTHDL